MAGGIKGITVEIGGDTTKLGKALADVNSKTKSLQGELKGVNTLLEMDPGNVTLLAQKQDLLTQAITGTKEKLETLKLAQEQAQEQFEKGEITEAQYRDLQREIIATEKKLEGLTDELKNFGSVGAQQVAQVGEKMKDVGGKVTEFGKGFSVVSAGTGAVLAGSIAVFAELDEGYDTIITKTGATGEALEDLNTVADNIFSSMPVEMATVGTAVGEINTRFGYTGEQLEALSTQFIQFAEINEVDLNNSIGTVDKILEQFNMDASETGGVLDLVTQKAQQTGIGADTLMNLIQQNGATFKDMNMGVNEAVVLLSQFEANGVNVETAMKGLKKATVEYAKEGISMEKGLAKTIDTVKNAKTETEALAEVEKLFGAKGANEMVKAIREGRLSVDDLTGAMGDYGGVVSDTFTATLDPIDQGKVAMNNLKLAGSELGGVLQSTFAPMLTTIVEKLKSMATWFSNLSPGIQKTIVVVLSVVTALGPLIMIIGNLITSIGSILTFAPKLVTAFNGVKTAFSALGTAFSANPIGIVIVAVTALVAAFIYLWNNCEAFRNFFINLWEGIKNACSVAVDWIIEKGKAIGTFFTETLPAFFKTCIDWIKQNWQSILAFLINPFAGLFTYFYKNNTKFKEFVDNAVKFIKELPGKVWTWLSNTIAKVGTWIVNMATKAKEAGTKFVTSVVTFIQQLPGKIWTWLVNVASKVVQWGANLASKGTEAATKLFNSIVNKIKTLPSKMLTIGSDLVKGIWNGINNAFGWLTGKIKEFTNGVTDKLKSFFKIKSPSRVMRDEVGKQLVAGIIAGIDAEKDNAKKSAQELGELYLKEIESTIKKKQDYREIAIGDEIFLWSEVLKEFEKGSDNYKDAELKLLDAHTRFIDDQRKTNNMSVQDEMAYWLNLSATCEEGSVLYKGIMERFTEANKEYEDSFVENHKKYVEERKKDNNMSLSDEIQYWKKLLKQTTRYSTNYYQIYDAMLEAEKKLTEESKKLQTDYLEDVQSIKDNLIKDIQAVTDAYDKAVNDRKKSIVSSMGLFDAFKRDSEIDKYTLTDNLESQVEALKEWDSTLDELSKRTGLQNSGLLTDLQNMGVSSLGTLQQINSMSDEELQNYIDLYNEKNRIALERATTENEPLRIESERQIQQLTMEANQQLSELENTYSKNLASIGITMEDHSAQIGRNIVSGLMSGIDSETPTFQRYLTTFFNNIVSSAEQALGIHSPSRVFADVVGKQIPAGIAKGVIENSDVANKAITDMSNNLAKEAMNLDGATINRKLNATFSAKLGNGRTLTDIMDTMIKCSDKIYDRLNRLQIVLDSDTLVGETIDKIDARLADRQILTARGL